MACFSKCHFYSGLVQRAMWIKSFEGSDTFLSIIENHLYDKVLILCGVNVLNVFAFEHPQCMMDIGSLFMR
jgi:hypothetical protein